ncbi:MAG: hypothetical protein IPJ74_15800 [Saprospiraceae bacterium]|nr:hypothetical protein [Saprospiraceae bacterium]
MTRKEEILAWKDGLLVFDTSVLLDLYFYSKSTRQEIVKSYFEKLQKKLWISQASKIRIQRKQGTYHKNKIEKYDFLLMDVPQQKDLQMQ